MQLLSLGEIQGSGFTYIVMMCYAKSREVGVTCIGMKRYVKFREGGVMCILISIMRNLEGGCHF